MKVWFGAYIFPRFKYTIQWSAVRQPHQFFTTLTHTQKTILHTCTNRHWIVFCRVWKFVFSTDIDHSLITKMPTHFSVMLPFWWGILEKRSNYKNSKISNSILITYHTIIYSQPFALALKNIPDHFRTDKCWLPFWIATVHSTKFRRRWKTNGKISVDFSHNFFVLENSKLNEWKSCCVNLIWIFSFFGGFWSYLLPFRTRFAQIWC